MTTMPMTLAEVPIDQLRPDAANPRRMGEEELDSLERSIRQFGSLGIATGWLRAKMASTVFPVGVSAAKNAH